MKVQAANGAPALAVARWLAASMVLLVLDPAAAATFSRLLPGFTGYGEVSPVAAAADGGIFAAGSGTGSRAWLMKLDAASEPLWTVWIGVATGGGAFAFADDLRVLVPTPDGGVLVVGSYAYEPLRDGVRLLRFDASGGVAWQRSYKPGSVPQLADTLRSDTRRRPRLHGLPVCGSDWRV